MNPFYLVSEPVFALEEGREKFRWPSGQAGLCRQVLSETRNLEAVKAKLREEYLAIIYSLLQMGIEFRIIFSHQDKIDKRVLGVCGTIGCRMIGFPPDYFPPAVIYPRDFATVLKGIVLVNNKVIAEIRAKEKDGYQLILSPYGEGGRVLNPPYGDTTIVCERLILGRGRSIDPKGKTAELERLGIKVGIWPAFVSGTYIEDGGREQTCFTNDHLDRVGCLLLGRDHGLHAVVDPKIETANWRGKRFSPPWTLRGPGDSLDVIKRACEPLEIEVYTPRQLLIPYSLNLLQFPDSRVLMTSGDEGVAQVVGDIVGEDRIVPTPAPIRYYPVWAYAGIHCLVSEAPLPLMRPVEPRTPG